MTKPNPCGHHRPCRLEHNEHMQSRPQDCNQRGEDRLIKEVIKDIDYKEGWVFEYEPGDYPQLLITTRLPNARGPGIVEFTAKRLIPEDLIQSAAHVTAWVKLMIVGIEFHEIDENFRYKGELVHDPHQVKIVTEETTP
jgi:hypothetical protein